MSLRTVSFLAAFVFTFSVAPDNLKGDEAESPPVTVHAGKVVAVVDGDTIDVLVDEEPIRIRLEGIDAPEDGQAFGTQAKKALSRAIFTKWVEVTEVDRDRWGRIIGRVHLGKRDVNLAMVRVGMAWHYTEYSDEEALAEAQAEANKKRRGLWRDNDPTPPWEFRKQQKAESAQ
ncbi:MAG: thermonuclease family protein [Planctomycetota bacterium]